MTEGAPCARCGQVAETYNWERDSTFWGWIGLGTATTVAHHVRIKSEYLRREPGRGSPLLLSDETRPLCADCWSALVGEFMNGREVPALEARDIPGGAS